MPNSYISYFFCFKKFTPFSFYISYHCTNLSLFLWSSVIGLQISCANMRIKISRIFSQINVFWIVRGKIYHALEFANLIIHADKGIPFLKTKLHLKPSTQHKMKLRMLRHNELWKVKSNIYTWIGSCVSLLCFT